MDIKESTRRINKFLIKLENDITIYKTYLTLLNIDQNLYYIIPNQNIINELISGS